MEEWETYRTSCAGDLFCDEDKRDRAPRHENVFLKERFN
jgi:hypothetical protein